MLVGAESRYSSKGCLELKCSPLRTLGRSDLMLRSGLDRERFFGCQSIDLCGRETRFEEMIEFIVQSEMTAVTVFAVNLFATFVSGPPSAMVAL